MNEDYMNIKEYAQKKCKYHSTPTNQRQLKDPHIHETFYHRKPICNDVLEAVGNTPLIKINNITKSLNIKCELLAKCEFFNPMGSAKDRVARRMVLDAEKQNLIQPNNDYTIIEPTSGNTGIGLAMVGIVRGYKVAFTLPDRMSQEKVDIMQGLGAKVIRTRSDVKFQHEESAAGVCKKIVQTTPNSICLDQYTNPSNPMSHYDQTAEEIIEQCNGKIDYFVCSPGTGGTLTGMARKLKEKIPNIKIIAGDPEGSVLSVPKSLNVNSPHPYKVEGNGKDFVARTCEQHESIVDEWIKVNDKDSFTNARRLIKEEGLLVGGSSGSAMTAALKICEKLPQDKRVVVFFTDGIRNYMSKFLNDDWMLENGYITIDEYEKNNFSEGMDKVKAVLPKEVSDVIHLLSKAEIIYDNELENKTIKDLLSLFKTRNTKVFLVMNSNGKINGLFIEKNVTLLLMQCKVTITSKIQSALTKEFRLMNSNEPMYYLSRALSRYEYVIVLSQKDNVYYICEYQNVLDYMMNNNTNDNLDMISK